MLCCSGIGTTADIMAGTLSQTCNVSLAELSQKLSFLVSL